jgi:transketolase
MPQYHGMKPTRFGFGEGLEIAGKNHPEIIALGADITSSVSMNLFANKFPDRFISIGIAEQNIAGIAAGLALSDKLPVFSTYAVFSAIRDLDQIRISICYNNLHVIIGGAHAGISVGPDGATHQGLEDIAVMRVLPNMTVLSPCDATQAKLAVQAAIDKINGPVYIRFGRESVPDFTSEKQDFIIGKAQKMKEGSDITICATGHMTWEALIAAKILETEHNIKAEVLNFHTIKPIDKTAIINSARKTNYVLTTEEHQASAGFGSAISEVLSQNFPVKMRILGINDTFGESGNPSELMNKYKLTANNIVTESIKLISK